MYYDFIADYTTDSAALSRQILTKLTINRAKCNKPTVVWLTGGSGEGKSYTGLALLNGICEEQGIDFAQYVDEAIIYTPMQYAQKVDAILYKKELKELNCFMIDEAREVVKAKLWYSVVNQMVADVNAMARGVKPLVTFVVSQYGSDVDKDLRKTATYYGTCKRPMHQATRLRLFRTWCDDYDLENIKLRKRPIIGIIKKDGMSYKMKPIFKVKMPKKEIVDKYEKLQFDAKSILIRQKLNRLLSILQKDYGDAFSKIDSMVSWYVSNPQTLNLITVRRGKKIKLKKEVQEMHDLNREELAEFEKRLFEKMKEKGVSDGMEELREEI